MTFSGDTVTTGGDDDGDGSEVYVLADGNATAEQATFIDDILGQAGSSTVEDFDSDTINDGATPDLSASSNDLVTNNPVATGLPEAAVVATGDPLLGALADNGGPSHTMALETGSPAISAGVPADFPNTDNTITTDQAGYTRSSTTPDLGALSYLHAPYVEAVSPDSGPVTGGTTVVITGTGFTGATIVDFGSTSAIFMLDSDTEITATSPAGTAGPVDVTVTNADGTSPTSDADVFTYVAVPTVSGVSPTEGPTAGGTSVTITGSSFTAATAVDFGTTPALFTVDSATEITATSPAGSAGPVNITVEQHWKPMPATSDEDVFTYVTAPSVSAVSPTEGPTAGGTSVTITGTDFTGATAVDFGTTPALFTVDFATEITATSPAGAAGPVNVTVVTPGGTSATSYGNVFTYVTAPTVSAVSPIEGPTAGGTSVTITGTDFTGATAVDFGTTPALFTVDSPTEITATSPAGAAGPVNVTVVTPGGTSPTSGDAVFTYVTAPTVSAVSPTEGPTVGGTSVTITGTDFTGATAVDFGATPALFTVDSATEITAKSPAGAAGPVNITVVAPGGTSPTSGADVFTYVTAPTASALSPNEGPTAGGTSVTITGTGFTGATAVEFGTTTASFTVDSATEITATSPAGAAGPVNITVVRPEGTSATDDADVYTYVTAPAVSAVSPNEGPTAGGTSVRITGTGFTGATAVDFGGTPAASFVLDSPTEITATSPPGSSGTVDVEVTTVGGTSPTSLADQFTYGSATVAIGGGPIDLGSAVSGTAGPTGSYAVDGSNLQSGIIIMASTGVELSDNGGNTWQTSLDLPESGGAVASTNVLVRIAASASPGSISGDIVNASPGAPAQDVPVSGMVRSATQGGAVVAAPSQTYFGQSVTLTATFFATANGSAPMTGTVAFYDGASLLGTTSVTPIDPPGTVYGSASLTTSALPVGNNNITAVYSGDASYSGATAATSASVQVMPAQTSLTLSVSTTAQGTILTATIFVTTPGNPPVTGTVTFYDGTTLLGTAPVLNDVATFDAGSLSPGAHAFRAVTNGGADEAGSGATANVSITSPTIIRAQRYGFHHQRNSLVLWFSSALDPATAEHLANYSLVGPLRGKGLSGHKVDIKSAVYNPASNTVVLAIAGSFNVHLKWELTVMGKTGGVTGPTGTPLTGSADGVAHATMGTNFVATITEADLAGSAHKLVSLGLGAAGAEAGHARAEVPLRGLPAPTHIAVSHPAFLNRRRH